MNNENSEIKTAILKIWNEYIKRDYEDGKIAYESDLDFRLGAYLLEILEKKGYEIFSKPHLVTLNKYPDYVICKDGEIMAFVELKLKGTTPHGKIERPEFEIDFYKFIEYFKAKNNFSEKLSLDPKTGEMSEEKEYRINDNVEFYFCVIAMKDAAAVYCECIKEILENDPEWTKNNQLLTREVLKRTSVFYGRIQNSPEFGYCTF